MVVNYSPLDAQRALEFKVGDSETDILVTLDAAALYPQAEALLRSTRLKKLSSAPSPTFRALPARSARI